MKDIINITAAEENEQLLKIITNGSGASFSTEELRLAEPFPLFIIDKIKNREAVIAVTQKNIWVGYFYLKLEEANDVTPGSGLCLFTACRVYCISGRMKEEILTFLKNRDKKEQERMFRNR